MYLSRGLVTALFAAALVLGACTPSFKTSYSDPVPVDVSAGWRLNDVKVVVPESLTVSEAHKLLPRADIVWREDPADGNRKLQVAQILGNATRLGAAGLQGDRPVNLVLTVKRFHALTFEAETRMSNAGVHNIDFTLMAVDAATGQVLAGPEEIQASFPALAGAEMVAARARGETQKSQITAHVRDVIAGWLGMGTDPRRSFKRLGG